MFWEWQRLSYQRVLFNSLYFLLAMISISVCLSVLPSLIIHVKLVEHIVILNRQIDRQAEKQTGRETYR